MTPEIKAMLRRKNKLMRAGRVDEAGVIATRVGASIVKSNAAQFRCADDKIDAHDMWKKVKSLTSHSTTKHHVNDVTATALNDYYASISTDSAYESLLCKLIVTQRQT